MDYDYDAGLERAMESTPDFGGSDARLTIPDPHAQRDGAFTRLTNLGEIADALGREPDHLHSIIQRVLGTAGQFEGDWARYNGNFSSDDFQAALDDYVAEYVTCSECGLPDTKLTMEGRTQMLRCEACGAFRPVSKKPKSTNARKQQAVEEGETYELELTGTGRKGDGTVQKGEYTVFVEGAREGQTVKARVHKVTGNLAFARRVD